MSEQPPKRLPDEELVGREIQDAILEEREISDSCARIIASWWHAGQASATYSFQSTGAIDAERIRFELIENYNLPHTSDFDRLAIDYLGTYLQHAEGVDEAGNRGPVPDWHQKTAWGLPE